MPRDVLNEVPEVLKPPLGKASDVKQVLNVHVELLVVHLDVKNIFDVVPAVINFVLTNCDVVLVVDDLDEPYELDAVGFNAATLKCRRCLWEVVLCNLLQNVL